MSEPIKCYAVTSGDYSDYTVHAIYRRREDAENRCKANNQAKGHLVDGVPADWDEVEKAVQSAGLAWEGGYLTSGNYDEYAAHMKRVRAWRNEHMRSNPAREESGEMRVEEFDYYEGEPLPAPMMPS
jgi:hypothetical protein